MVTSSRKLNSIYEINTPVYLEKLSSLHGQPISLASIPDEELTRIASYGCDSVWLMGVWKRSQVAIDITLQDQPLLDEVREILPDFQPSDIIGSAYAIGGYEVNDALGGEAELIRLRRRLAEYGLKLILDFVPNHTAFDHDWTTSHPEYYVSGTDADLTQHPSWYRQCGNAIIAHGRDPHFEPWPDVAQLNAFSVDYRKTSIDTLGYIASLCDGVRCDMAMLMTNEIFSRTWGEQAGTIPSTEYWHDVIGQIHQQYENFTFIAECYWDMQAALISQGFDYCYDKDLYDELVEKNIPAAQKHIGEVSDIADHLVSFLENHDEPRAAAVFDLESHQNALRFIASLPGPKLWHDGQFEGYRTKLPVHIGRGPVESTDACVADMYHEELQK